jgi:hypothetical protein
MALMDMSDGAWKPVPGFPNYAYRGGPEPGDWIIARAKAGWCAPIGLLMAPHTVRDGRVRWFLREGGKRSSIARARLICFDVYGPPPEGFVAAHNDGDPTNDRPSNLRWATDTENAADRDKHGRTVRGTRHHRAKLTERDIFEICGAKGSQTEIASRFGISQVQVSNILRGKNWSHVPAERRLPCR